MLYCVQNFSHFVKLVFFKKFKKTTMAPGVVKRRICDDGVGVALGNPTMLPSGGGSG
jgi:hypothetical protein